MSFYKSPLSSHAILPSSYFISSSVLSSNEFSPCTQSIAYIHDPSIGYYHYGPGHPMKPYRLALTHDLVVHYELPDHMRVVRGRQASPQDLLKFHSPDYVEFLQRTA